MDQGHKNPTDAENIDAFLEDIKKELNMIDWDASERRTEEAPREIHRRSDRRAAPATDKKRPAFLILLCVALLAGVALILVGVLGKDGVLSNAQKKDALLADPSILQGSFRYDASTCYLFDGAGNGAMVIETGEKILQFDYTYVVKSDILELDFRQEEVTDAAYTFRLKNDKMVLTGGNGTVGGEYILYRE